MSVDVKQQLILSIMNLMLIIHLFRYVDATYYKPKPIKCDVTRPGTCPHPLYVTTGISCSKEGLDSSCPPNHKCCPSTENMQCLPSCEDTSSLCKLKCQFGLKVGVIPCKTCECADSPCLSTKCPFGTICKVDKYRPCAIDGRCGYVAKCIRDPSIPSNPLPKPHDCPYPTLLAVSGKGSKFQCNDSDAECPAAQKCCSTSDPFSGSTSYISYCTNPCKSLERCNLKCPYGFVLKNDCQICKCKPDPCIATTCPVNTKCEVEFPVCIPESAPGFCDPRPVCKEQKISDTRPGRCPHAQYVGSGIPCSSEGNDTVCPYNYKCCPLIDGMKCFAPCDEFSSPCKLQCPFGLKLGTSPCTVCECAENPCIKKGCPWGTLCKVQKYQPCAVEGRCGVIATCVADPSVPSDPLPKPGECPDPRLLAFTDISSKLPCQTSDAECPGSQKCCSTPNPISARIFDSFVSYCTNPCRNLLTCKLNCKHGFVYKGECPICQCKPDPCCTVKCSSDEKCELVFPPCRPESPPSACEPKPVCVKISKGIAEELA